ncbi:hypothetical protein D8674_003452 [Pyrus ussuriensis x Pyrus communis]|uniref:UDP-glycosyltransferase 74E2-like n=1 Tax=Pyrus ussuriensis x Pyrus communis TaxID=2448454 RepID=A0A5N5FHP0_9ROSA|nr:hypothetical protein D8674_003452 [Pyrus ussuriensis x Pyrus communis]
MEKKERGDDKAHCLVLPYPSQGHINPMLQFSKVLQHKGLKITLVTTHRFHSTMHRSPFTSIAFETISDSYDEGGFLQAETAEAYLDSFQKVGTNTLIELLEKLSCSGNPVDCIVYDAFMPWPLDVAKKYGIVGAVFLTQSCAVDNIYYHVQQGLLKLHLPPDCEILLPGLPPLQPSDMPSFIHAFGSYPAFFKMVVDDQFSNVDKADWILCNTFYELEEEVVDWMAKFWPLRTIRPTIPSKYLDNRREDDTEYGFSLFNPNTDACMNYLCVSFGSLAELGAEQMEELSWGLKSSKSYFLWVVREKEAAKLPKGFVEETSEKGFVVSWCPQLEVLAHEAVGCFLGVPMVAVPQWTNQSTNARFIMDVWKMGLTASADESGIVRQEEIARCVREILEGDRGTEIRMNALKWKTLATTAVDEGGSSDKNIDEFIAKLVYN